MAGSKFSITANPFVRSRDTIIRIADWHRITSGTGGYDVETYIEQDYRPELSDNFGTKAEAIEFIRTKVLGKDGIK